MMTVQGGYRLWGEGESACVYTGVGMHTGFGCCGVEHWCGDHVRPAKGESDNDRDRETSGGVWGLQSMTTLSAYLVCLCVIVGLGGIWEWDST